MCCRIGPEGTVGPKGTEGPEGPEGPEGAEDAKGAKDCQGTKNFNFRSDNEKIKATLVHFQKNILALTAHIQKLHSEPQNHQNQLEPVNPNLEPWLEKLENQALSLTGQLRNVEEAHLSDYRTLMGRINQVR